MSRLHVGQTSRGYHHHVQRLCSDTFRLSWRFDYKVAGSRLRFTRVMTRDTDEAGARRFAAKWGCNMPEDKA